MLARASAKGMSGPGPAVGSVEDRDTMEGFLKHGARVSPSKVGDPGRGAQGARGFMEWIQT